MPESLLFCPFCRECYENEPRCPTHDLPLVSWKRLPADPAVAVFQEDQALAFYDVRFHRGTVFLGAALCAVAFFVSPFVQVVVRDTRVVQSAWALAQASALNLWVVPSVACAQIVMVLRQRTVVKMRRVRLAVTSLSVIALASVTYTLWHVSRSVTEASHIASHMTSHIASQDWETRWGAGVMVVGMALSAWGGLRLGRVKTHTAHSNNNNNSNSNSNSNSNNTNNPQRAHHP